MARIRATRVPAGSPPRTGTGPPPAIRYAANPAWPGITEPHDARCWACTWGVKDGTYQVKYLSAACGVHRRASSG